MKSLYRIGWWGLGLVFLLVGAASLEARVKGIAPHEAKSHIGSEKNVCGYVVQLIHDRIHPDKPTYLYLDQAYPIQEFTILVPQKIRDQFSYSPDDLLQKPICVSGKIEKVKGKPQITLSDPRQILAP